MTCPSAGPGLSLDTISAGPGTDLDGLSVGPALGVCVASDGSGSLVFTGHGPPPTTIPGAKAGDYYLDDDTGELYELEPGA